MHAIVAVGKPLTSLDTTRFGPIKEPITSLKKSLASRFNNILDGKIIYKCYLLSFVHGLSII